MSIELTEALLQKCAGWDVVKRARSYVAAGQVSHSSWQPPRLEGLVQNQGVTFRACMKLQSAVDVENLCTCRESREWGKICAHSVAVALHWIEAQKQTATVATAPPSGRAPSPTAPLPKSAASLQRTPDGEPVELFLILPPNFEQAIARGKVMVVFEAKWGGGRCPLNALPKGRSFKFSTQDNTIIERLETLADGETPALLQLDAKDFAALLPLLAEHENITLGKASAVKVSRTPFHFPLRATLEANGEIVLALRGGDASSPAQSATKASPPPLVTVGDWAWHQRILQPLDLPPMIRDVWRGPVRISRTQVPLFLSQHWPQLQATGAVETNFQLEDFSLDPQTPRFELSLRGGLAQLRATLRCAYGSRTLSIGPPATVETVWLPDPERPTHYATRDFAAEQLAVARLQRHGFIGPDREDQWVLDGSNAVLNFFAREYPSLQEEWQVTLDAHLEQRTLKNIERIEPRFEVTSSGVQWFDLGMVFSSSGGETFSPADIQRLLRSGQSHTRLKNGKFAVLDTGAVEELQETLLDCAPQQHANGYRINSQQAGFLEATLRQHSNWKVQAPGVWRERAARQSGEMKLECPPLGSLETVLRPYQKQGVAWLRLLRENQFGGILADEMGLGKTLQALVHLRLCQLEWAAPDADAKVAGRGATVDQSAASRRPHLIVCPTSLVFNWLAEAGKFVPDLRVIALHGPRRHQLFAEVPHADIALTSYALIRRDAERYRELEFDTVILDEAQHIKNRQTQNAQAVKAIRSRHRLVLTGTPLENSVLDLWSIFDFLMPGYLGTARDFHERYEVPIVKEKSAAAQTRLARRLRPFLLRRLKREVAPDLPAKLEQVAYCELTPNQRAVYQQFLEATRQEVLAASGPQHLARNRMLVLTALLRLRQVCCDLRLLPLEQKTPPPSGKFDLFRELLEQVLDGGHRVLVFSQFVAMLQLLKAHLEAEGIDYCYLDGATTDRARVVERFQTQRDVPVFLISLKAGGVGLNLTGADTVIHFDPWWNPAVEDQATDRAHRLGQQQVVTSYKLITRETVEEKILLLQQRKRDVIAATVGGEETFASTLSWEEIQELLA